ncbi:SNARE associated Golgi protein [Bacillus cytotoxicus]|nr:SNARE associated Golgi protein [Bacillus cytotoxicus]
MQIFKIKTMYFTTNPPLPIFLKYGVMLKKDKGSITMDELIYDTLKEHDTIAIPLSILFNIVISLLGLIPSIFLTAINIQLFGLLDGTMISITGEALGAIVSFYLYRLGLQKFTHDKINAYPKIKRLLYVKGKEAFFLVLSFRLVPFIPSSIITLFAALGKISLLSFSIASTIGKIPALLIEVYSAYHVMNGTNEAKWIITIASCIGIIYIWRKWKKK